MLLGTELIRTARHEELMDDQLRLLERRATQGDPEAEQRLRRERVRAGLGLGRGAWMVDVLEAHAMSTVGLARIASGVRAVLRASGIREVRASALYRWGDGPDSAIRLSFGTGPIAELLEVARRTESLWRNDVSIR